MIRFQLTMDGRAEFERRLAADQKRFDDAEELLLRVLGQTLASKMKLNIRTEGRRLADRGISWPALDPRTVAIRQHFGHPGPGPRLIRGGDLLRSIRVLDEGKDYVEVGSLLEAGAAVHFGGEISDGRGRRRTVQAFPWALPSEQDLDDMTATILEVVVDGEGVA